MTEKTKNPDSNIRSQMRKGILEYCVLLLLSRQRAYPSDIINGPPRKYYFITEEGKDTLAEMSAAWDEIVANVNHFRNLQ